MGKVYFGNFPNSRNYDTNVPIGYNQWDASEFYGEDYLGEKEDNDPGEIIPDEEEEKDLKNQFP